MMNTLLQFLKRNFLSILLLLGVTAYLGYQRYTTWKSYSVLLGTDAPQISLSDATDPERSQLQLKGRQSLLIFWATWCPSCRAEIGTLNEIHKQIQSKSFQLVSIVLPRNESRSDILQFQKESQIAYPVLYDDQGIANEYRVLALPTMVWVNSAGQIEDVDVGISLGLQSKVEDWLAKPKP